VRLLPTAYRLNSRYPAVGRLEGALLEPTAEGEGGGTSFGRIKVGLTQHINKFYYYNPLKIILMLKIL